MSSKRRSTRQALTRKRSLYLDPDTDDDFAVSEADDGEAVRDEASPEPPPKRTKANNRPPRQTQRETRSKAAAKAASRASPPKQGKRKSKHLVKPTKESPPIAAPIPSDGVIPNWSSLPYAILLQIFEYAFAAELETENGVPASRRAHHPNTWVMRSARKVCGAFAEPALTAYYESPKLLSNRWLEDLMSLVQTPQEQLKFKYRMKIKRLEISARDMVSNVGVFSLPALVRCLPQLSHVSISHPLDEPPFYTIRRLPRWKYPLELFDALDETGIRLSSWRWNIHFVPTDQANHPELSEYLIKAHSRPCFESLQHLTISHIPGTIEAIQEPNPEDPSASALAGAIRMLPKLTSLALESCDGLFEPLLTGLPDTLESLRIVNCMSLNSDALQGFLSRDGGRPKLKSLVLDHNPWLDLDFLTTLGSTCPNLERLHMDLYDFREKDFKHFGEPKYDVIFGDNEVPTWPSTLRSFEIYHISKCGHQAGANIFRSLAESADRLLELRKLVLHAHVNIPWRDRAAFRDEWIERLRRVFLRRAPDPDPKFASMKTFRLWKEAQERSRHVVTRVLISPRKEPNIPAVEHDTSDSDALSKRRSRRIADLEEVSRAEPPPEPTPAPNQKRARRTLTKTDSLATTATSDDDSNLELDAKDSSDWFIQGMCDMVDIRIDNQRPREEQLNESHFLDSEQSGDEEWTEGAELAGEDYAW